MNLSPNMLGVLYAIIAYTCYTIADAALKFAGQMDLEIYQIAFYTQGIGVIAIALFAIATKRSLKTYHLKLQFYRSVAYAICYAIIIYAFKHKSLIDTYTLFYISPFMAAIFSWWILSEPIGKHRLLAIILGFIGVLVVLRPGFIEFDWLAVGILIASTLFAYANVLTRKIGESEPILSFTFYTTGMIFLMNAVPFAFDFVLPSADAFKYLATAGIVETFATGLVALAYLKTHAVTISKLIYVSVIWALVWGWLFFDDILMDFWTFIGAVIIISSGLYMIYREHKNAHASSSNQISQE
ncbi:MAG: DMT family transporter [Pseudomonadota bacterium]